MAVPTWDQLQKNQTDSETIEEAITRIIGDHNNNPTAHLDAGQSLQSHKASAIIDHLAESIVADKLADGSVEVEKFSWNKMFLYPSLESQTGWDCIKQGTLPVITMGICDCLLQTGHEANSLTSIGLQYNGPLEADPYYYPAIELRASFFNVGHVDYCITAGSAACFDLGSGGFGFESLKTDSHVFAFYINSGVKYRTSLTISSLSQYHRYRAECIAGTVSGKYTINYYVDGTLVYTYANVDLDFSNDHAFVIGVRQGTANNTYNRFYVSCISYSQNYT